MNARVCVAVAGLAGIPLVAGCDDGSGPPTTIVVNTPPADGGQLVLLTVMVGVALLALVAAGGFAWVWAQERRGHRDARRARREAEDAVLALTGRSIEWVRWGLGQQPLPGDRPHALDPRRREIEGWRR
jgi:hypothetical protein